MRRRNVKEENVKEGYLLGNIDCMAANWAAIESIEAIFCVSNLFKVTGLLFVNEPVPVINGKLLFVLLAAFDDDSFESLSQSSLKRRKRNILFFFFWFSAEVSNKFWVKLTFCMWSVSDPVGPDSATNSPLAFTVSSLPLTQKWHLSFGFQSMGSGGGGDGVNGFDDVKVFVVLFLLLLRAIVMLLLLLLLWLAIWSDAELLAICDAKFL